MTGNSKDLIAENIEQLKVLFPEAVTEGKLDFEVLQALLGEEIEKRQTYYKFTWNGKEEARAYARIPSMGTLRPCIEESSGKDGIPGKFDSENLYIEGDNLEVLKLLQGSYHKKVKMIYIDPPYNTGKDFVYPDNYHNSLANYKSLTGQTDAEGKATHANPETSGRYHTDWLNMMYPRLILARNLLADDGIIFASIAEDEVANLRKIFDDIFGEENFISCFVWEKGKEGGNDSSILRTHYDNILCYGKELNSSNIINLDAKDTSRHITVDKEPNLVSGIEKDENEGELFQLVNLSKQRDYTVKIPLLDGTIIEWPSFAPQHSIDKWIKIGKVFVGEKHVPYVKSYLKDELQGQKPSNIIGQEYGTTKAGSIEIREFFGNREIFSYPKPSSLIKRLLGIGSRDNSIILDFFSGSATTAHAVMQLNTEDSGHRHYIMVQLPEVCEKGTEAAKAGYKNICEIGKERIRRAAKKIRNENPLTTQNQDMGFKVFKLDTSNFIPWNPEPEKIELFMRNTVENILTDRSRQDLLYEVLLKCNLPLTLPIDEKKFGENTVYVVGAGALAICLDTTIPQSIADEIVKLRDEYAPIVPMQVVFRDNGFTDVAKTNSLQILKQAGFEEKSIQSI